MSAIKELNSQRNSFAFLGLTEKWISEDPEYMKIFDFEKQDFIPLYQWIHDNLNMLFGIAPLYLLGIFGLQRWMRDRKPFDLRPQLTLWSASLAIVSLVMFIRILPEMLYINKQFGFYRSYCKLDHLNSATLFWSVVYTFTKILEFIDTVFIVLRKKPLTFLHVFHHTSVYIASVFGLLRLDNPAKYFILFNVFVHANMYTYYALKAANFKLPRKLSMAITSMQLIQFTLASAINFLVGYSKLMGSEPKCERSNDIFALYSVLGVAYLYLFGNFFVQTYLKRDKMLNQKLQ